MDHRSAAAPPARTAARRAPAPAVAEAATPEMPVWGWSPLFTAGAEGGDCVLDCCRPIRAGDLVREHERAHVLAHDRCIPRRRERGNGATRPAPGRDL